jgi:hypothetical protein
VKGGEGEIGAVHGNAVCREGRSRPWEEPDSPTPSTLASPTSSTSSTSRRRRHRLPPRRRAAPPHFTNSCTTARRHQVEDGHFPALVDASAFEPRGNVPPHRTAAAPPVVMPAIVPGWVKSLAGVAAFVNARTPFWLSLSFSPSCAAPCCSRSRCRAVLFSVARMTTRARRSRANVHPSTCAHQPGSEAGPLVPFSCVGPRRRVSVDRAATASPWSGTSRTQS